MHLIKNYLRNCSALTVLLSVLSANHGALAETSSPLPTLQINAGQTNGTVAPIFYGLMTEEINYSYEGGLYGELIRNRAFKANATNAVFWDTIGSANIALDNSTPLNDALNVSLKLDASAASEKTPAGIVNGGFWGIPAKPKSVYHVSFFAKAANDFNGPLTVSLESADGKTVFAHAEISGLSGEWKKYETNLKLHIAKGSKENVFKITTSSYY